MGPAFSLASTLGVMVAVAGSLTIAALLGTTIVLLLVAITFMQLITRFPDAGSSYGWARRAFGEGIGAYTAWILIVANFFAVLATAIPAGTYTLELFAPSLVNSAIWSAGIGCAWVIAIALVLFLGIRSTARVAAVLLIAELVVLAASAFVAMSHAPPASSLAAAPSHSLGAIGFIEAMVLGIWMVDGWEVTASTSEETRANARVAGVGGIVGLLVTAVFLIACTLAYMHAGGVQGLAANQSDVLAFVGERLGSVWRTLLVITVLVSLAAALETTLLYLVRSVYAMGRDGVLPSALRSLNVALVAVTIASLVAMAIVGLVPSANDRLTLVLNGSAVFLGMLFLISCLAALRLRREETPLFAAAGALALVIILTVAIVQATPATRGCILVALGLGLPITLGFAMRERMRKGQSPAAGNIGG